MKPSERNQPDQTDPRSNTPTTFTSPQHVPLLSANGDVIALAMVDPDDLERVNQHAWHLHSDGYAFRRIGSGRVKALEYMHRLVIDAPAHVLVDHVDGNRLNNTVSNLRLATPSQNNANGRDRPRRSGFRGVYPHKPTGRWIAQISVGGHVRHLGIYNDAGDAARAYDHAAQSQWGPFARINGVA